MICSSAITNAVLNGHAGADPNIKSKDGRTLLITAVQQKHPMIIDFLLDESIYPIDDLELASGSLVSSSSIMEELSYMLSILQMAIERRVVLNMTKVCLEVIAVYDYHQECQTVDELDSIKDDAHRIFIETLLIRERIALSRNDISLIKPLHSYGDSLVKKGQLNKSLNVWLFCRMLRANKRIPVAWFRKVGRLVFKPSHLEEKKNTAHNVLFLIIIATKVFWFSLSNRIS